MQVKTQFLRLFALALVCCFTLAAVSRTEVPSAKKPIKLFNGKNLNGWSNGNSGVFFRSTFDGTKVKGWQVEVAPPNHDTGGVYESYERGWLKQIPDEEEGHLKMGEWNKMRIRVDGDHVQTWLNGHAMVDFKDQKIGEHTGSIALQIHDGGGIKVRWRNMMLTEL